MPDISLWVQHAWYEEVWYRDVDKVDKLGLWLGAATHHGGGDTFWILGKSCKPLVRSTVWSVTVEEKQTLEVQSLSEELHASVKSKIGDNRTDDDEVNQELEDIFPEPDEDLYFEDDTEEEEKTADRRSEADEYTPEAFDNYLNTEVMLPRGGENVKATIIKRSKNADGIPTGTASSNPILYTRDYVARFQDGAEQAYAANLIAENLYSQVDSIKCMRT
jgi:hypothetical protein